MISGDDRFRHLLSSGHIGDIETRNRIVMAGMGTNFGDEDGYVTERAKRYYEARARGGAGVIVLEVTSVDYPGGACTPGQLGISSDAFLPGLKELTGLIHQHGAKAAIQLHHGGKNAVMDIAAGREMLVPSEPSEAIGGMEDLTPEETQSMVKNLTSPSAKLHYRTMSVDDIGGTVEIFANAAVRARDAGFDGVEVHAGHGYLIAMFLSPATNKRTDSYGGTVDNRSRFLVEIIQAIKKKAGNDFPVWFRLDAKEFRIENGITLEDACRTAQLAEAAGANAVHVSAYANPALGFAFTEAPLVHESAGYLDFAAQIKKMVKIPVIAVGRIEPEVGSQAIQEGKTDFVAMGRKLLADPDLPKKLMEGRIDDIRSCLYCYTCVGKIFINESVCCAANPFTGREAELEIIPAAKPRKVLIAGAGPAGMEAARIAALRGHKVSLLEKEQYLGGTAFLSSLVNAENGNLINHLISQINKLPIDIQTGREVSPDVVRELHPEVLLLAIGHKEEIPQIPGNDRRIVFNGNDLQKLMAGGVSDSLKKLPFLQRSIVRGGMLIGAAKDPAVARKLTKLWMPIGKRVAIIGGSLVGIELADFFSERGRSVTVMETGDFFAPQMAIPRRWRVLHLLRKRGATLLEGIDVNEIVEDGVTFTTKEGGRETVKADTVIFAVGTVPNQDLFEEFKTVCPEVHLLGDCGEIGYIEKALADGVRFGTMI